MWYRNRIKDEHDLREYAEMQFRGREVRCPVCSAQPMNPCQTSEFGRRSGRAYMRAHGSHHARAVLAKQLEEQDR